MGAYKFAVLFVVSFFMSFHGVSAQETGDEVPQMPEVKLPPEFQKVRELTAFYHSLSEAWVFFKNISTPGCYYSSKSEAPICIMIHPLPDPLLTDDEVDRLVDMTWNEFNLTQEEFVELQDAYWFLARSKFNLSFFDKYWGLGGFKRIGRAFQRSFTGDENRGALNLAFEFATRDDWKIQEALEYYQHYFEVLEPAYTETEEENSEHARRALMLTISRVEGH